MVTGHASGPSTSQAFQRPLRRLQRLGAQRLVRNLTSALLAQLRPGAVEAWRIIMAGSFGGHHNYGWYHH